jgi:putative heme iron utilization protein
MTPDSAFDPQKAAKKLLREGRSGALATLLPGTRDPYCSLVNVAAAADGVPLLLLSRLALHSKNILADPRASLMLDERKDGDPLQGARISLIGTIAATGEPTARARYLARHPEAEQFADFGDFAFYRLEVKRCHLVAGFGRIVDLAANDILTDLTGAATLLQAEPEIVAHLNGEHAEAVRLYATKLLGGPDGAWACVGCDPEGLDLQLGRLALRLPFAERITAPGALRQVLKDLAAQARGA